MTREKHDQYCKQFMTELLETKGEVQTQHEIPPGDAHQVDIYFRPYPKAELKTLGLLGEMVAKPCLIEYFRNQPTQIEVQTCLHKLFTLRSELLNDSDQKKNQPLPNEESEPETLTEPKLPRLWILTTFASKNFFNFWGAKSKHRWDKGVYFLPFGIRTMIVAIDRLTQKPETRLLRLLGKQQVQQQAIQEIRALKEDDVLRNQVEYLLFRWHICIKTYEQLDSDQQEILMNTSEIVEEYQQKILQQGVQQAMPLDKELVKNLLLVRFGAIDDSLSQIIERLLNLPPKESSRLILQSSREELLAKFL
jgi:hypothetical protein